MIYTGKLKILIVNPSGHEHSTEMAVSQYEQSVIEKLAEQLEETRREGEPWIELQAV